MKPVTLRSQRVKLKDCFSYLFLVLMQNKQKKIEQVNTKQLLMTEKTVRKLQNDIVSTHLIWKLIHNPFTPEILLVILLMSTIQFSWLKFGEFCFESTTNRLVDTFLYFNHSSAWCCFIRRNSVLVTYRSYKVNSHIPYPL